MPFGCHNIEIQFCHWVYGLQVVRNGNHLSEKHWLEEPTFDRCQKKNCYLLGNALGSWNAPATHKHVTTSFLRIDFWTSGLYVIYVLGMSNIYCISHCPDGLTPDHWVLLPSRQPPTSPFRTVWETMGEDLLYIRDDIIPAHKMMNYIKWHPFL